MLRIKNNICEHVPNIYELIINEIDLGLYRIQVTGVPERFAGLNEQFANSLDKPYTSILRPWKTSDLIHK